MAVSDPTSSVPTPTGTLQGVAAFSWDGSAWQPSGRSMASVATPTGVLRGVAPFSYSGTTWQTGGLSRPGVPTPTGTLDGVAVYTWNGSAWAPAGGGTTPTSSGTLQGVAAFYWDGSAWQPSGRAAPEVAIPGGVLAGVAMFNWNGSAWMPAVSAPVLDLNFLMMTTLDASITFTRASTATYFDANGIMQTAASNVPRLDHNPVTLAPLGLLIEEGRSNLTPSVSNVAATALVLTPNQATAPDGTNTMLRISDADTANNARYIGVAETVSAGASCTVSIYAKAQQIRYLQVNVDDTGGNGVFATFDLVAGTISGALAAFGTATTIGASMQNVGNGVYRLTVSGKLPAASTTARWLAVTAMTGAPGWVTGYVGNLANGLLIWGVQLEVGAFATSYIPTTTSAATRAIEVATMPSGSWRNAAAETFFAEYLLLVSPQETNARIIGCANAPTSYVPLFVANSTTPGTFDSAAILETANSVAVGTVAKATAAWTNPNGWICAAGGAVATSGAMTLGFSAVTAFAFMGDTTAADQANGYVRRFRYWPRVLSNAEMQAVTT